MQVKMDINTSFDLHKALETIEAQYDYRWSAFCAAHPQSADYFSVASQDIKVAEVCGIGHLPHGDRVRTFTITLHAAVDFLGADWVAENLLTHPFIHTATFYTLAGQIPGWIVQRLSAPEIEVSVMRVRAEITKAFEAIGAAPAVVTNVVTELESTEVTAEDAAAVEKAVEDAADLTAPYAHQDEVAFYPPDEQTAVEEAAEEEGATDEAAPTPVVVDLEVSEAEANEKYGSRYGIDWVYEGE